MDDDKDKTFNTADEAAAFIKTRVDDIERVVLYTAEVQATHAGVPTGPPLRNVGMVVHLVSKNKCMVSRAAAENLLNDGILNRLRIRIELGK